MRLFLFILFATIFEACGDAIVRKALFNHAGLARAGLMLVGAALLFGYGCMLNLAPLEFSKVVGLYIATLFVVWQIVTFVTFHVPPTLPVIIGGLFIVVGGAIISFWNPAA